MNEQQKKVIDDLLNRLDFKDTETPSNKVKAVHVLVKSRVTKLIEDSSKHLQIIPILSRYSGELSKEFRLGLLIYIILNGDDLSSKGHSNLYYNILDEFKKLFLDIVKNDEKEANKSTYMQDLIKSIIYSKNQKLFLEAIFAKIRKENTVDIDWSAVISYIEEKLETSDTLSERESLESTLEVIIDNLKD